MCWGHLQSVYMSVSVLVISSECVCGCEYVGDFFIVYVYM